MDNNYKPKAAQGHQRSGNFTIQTKPNYGANYGQTVSFQYYTDASGMTFTRQANNNFSEWSVGGIPQGAKLQR